METSQQDHDNIVTLLANVKTLTEEVRGIRDDTKEDVRDLQSQKLDIKEYNDFKVTLAKEAVSRDAEITRQFKEAETERNGQTKKLDKVWNGYLVGVTLLGVIEFIMPFVLKHFGLT